MQLINTLTYQNTLVTDTTQREIEIQIEDAEAHLSNVDGVSINQSDIGLFDAETATFSVLLDDLAGVGLEKIQAFTLVEQSTFVGDQTLDRGSFLFAIKASGNEENDIWYFDPTGVGESTTTGEPAQRFMEGADIGIERGEGIAGLDLIENTTAIGGTTLESGWILISTTKDVGPVGSSGIWATESDVFVLAPSSTTFNSGTTTADARLFMEGLEVGLEEEIDGLTLFSTQGAAVDVFEPTEYEITGTIYEDVDGDGEVLDDNQLLTGVSVFLFDDHGALAGAIDASDSLIASTTTDAAGHYSFGELADQTYWVVVDSTTVSPSAGYNPSFGLDDVWAEQTYGSAGSVADHGGVTYATAAGAFYGGKQLHVSDDASSLTSAEHVTRVIIAGGNKTQVDSGFSFNAITHTGDGDDDPGSNRTMQGSFRQFILNANAIDNALHGVNTSQFAFQDHDANHVYYQNDFIPGSLSNAVATGLSDASISDFDPDYPVANQHSWFRIDLDNSLAGLRITDTIHIDGYSQAGATQNNQAIGHNANLRIELTNSANDNHNGLNFASGANGSTLTGVAINEFGNIGVMVNYDVDNVTIQGNFIGTDISGTVDRGNAGPGIQIRSNNNLVGGPHVADRNLVSGNDNRGIALFTFGTITGNEIRNNYIGVDATGLAQLENGDYGIQLWNDEGTRLFNNVISGNESQGIRFRNGSETHDAVIQGNMIGVGADGTTIVANGEEGIRIDSHNATGILIGGAGSGEGNIISGNGADGIRFDGFNTAANLVYGNWIGTDVSGLLDLGNVGSGVLIAGNSTENTIGGVNAGQANVIAFNRVDGVAVNGNNAVNNSIRGNSIYSNTQLGIDLVISGGVDTNDPGDLDAGPNGFQNYPQLFTAVSMGGDLTITGSFNSTPNTGGFLIDFYWSPAGTGDPSSHGEATTYLGSTAVGTDLLGNATIHANFAGVSVPPGAWLTATATDPSGNTSEFSLNLAFAGPNLAPVLGNNELEVTEGQTVTVSAGMLNATDVDDPDPSLIFTVSNVSGGRFELIADAGNPIHSFTQAQVAANQVVFVDNGDEIAPTYDVEVRDGSSSDGPAAATITFHRTNDAPVGIADAFAGTSGNLLRGEGLLSNDFDVDSPVLTARLHSVPSHGVVTVNPNGSFVYRPDPRFFGTDSFTYYANDGAADSAPTQVVVEILGVSNNDNPTPEPSPDPEPESELTEIQTVDGAGPPIQIQNDQTPNPSLNIPLRISQPIEVASSTRGQIEVDSVRLANLDFSLDEASIIFQSENGLDAKSLDELRAGFQVNELINKSGWFWKALDENTNQMTTGTNLPEMILGSSAALASSVTVGYLIWLIKGGQVLAAVMANLPAWRLIDPLPILNAITDDREDLDSLQKIINDGETVLESTPN